MADSDDDSGGNHRNGNQEIYPKEQDRFLPIANVSRIMKRALPANAKISKDAKETVQECVSEFISFITGEASDKCQREKRKTINGDDLLWAMTTLGFEDYVEPLKVYLQRFRDIEGEKTAMAGIGVGGRHEKEGSNNGSSVNLSYTGDGVYGSGISYQRDRQGHVYGGSTGGASVYGRMGGGGPGKNGSGYVVSGPHAPGKSSK